MKYIKNDGGRNKAFPQAKQKIHDCVIRAIAIATGQDYKKVWGELFQTALEIGEFPNNDNVCIKYLEERGWQRVKFGKKLVRMSSKHIPKNETIICHTRSHWVSLKSGELHDTWDSRTNSYGDSARVFSYFIKS